MDNRETIEQLRADLVQRNLEHINDLKMLTDTCAARDVLARECNKREMQLALAHGKLSDVKDKLVQVREEAALLNVVLTDANELHAEVRAELTEARAELAAVDESLGEFYSPVLDLETDEPCGSFWKDHGVNVMSQSLEYAEQESKHLKTAYDREVETRVSAQMEAEGLQRQLAETHVKLTDARRVARLWFRKAARVCAELKDLQETDHKFGRQAIRRNRDYWYDKAVEAEAERDKMRQEMQAQSDEAQRGWLGPVEAEGLRRQLAKAQIQAATPKEAAVWLWGFYDGNTLIAKPGYEDDIREAWDKLLIAVDSIAGDALLERLATLDAAEAALAGCGIGGIYDDFNGLPDAIEQMTQYINELTREDKRRTEQVKALQDERRLRQEAEKRAECAEAANDHLRSVASQVPYLKDRTERAEALAALVTPKLAKVLDKLYKIGGEEYPMAANQAWALAARIREALEENDDPR